MTDIKELETIIRRAVSEEVAEKWQEAREKSLERTNTDVAVSGQEVKPGSDKEAKPEKGINFARAVRFLWKANGNPHLASEMATNAGYEYVGKALGETTLAGGGALLPEEFSNEIIELLGTNTVVRRAGCSTVPMNTGSLTMPFVATGSTASYTAESANITKSEPTFGQLQLHDHKLAALIPTSNDLLRNGGARVDSIIRNDIVRAMSRKEDVTFLRSLGVSSEPKGMRGWVDSGNSFAAAAVSVANVTADLGKAVFLLEDAEVDTSSASWFLSPRSKKYLMTARDGNNNLVWASEMAQGTLMGFPWYMTAQIANNYGSGSDESEVYFAAMDVLTIAENEQIMVEVLPNAAYHDGSAVVSGASRDETVIRSIAMHDFGARQRGKEIAYISEVKWGA